MIGLGVLASLALVGQGRAVAGDEPVGTWRVVERGLGLDSWLQRLDIEPGRNREEAALVATDQGDQVRGRARLVRQKVASGGPGVFEASWTEGPETFRLQLRSLPEGRMTALVRRRSRDQPWASPEQVRQVVLERDAVERPAALPGEPPRVARSPQPARVEVAALYTVKIDGSDLRVIARPDEFTRAAQPAWSPDGRRLAFSAFDPTGRDPLIRVVPAAGGPTTAVASGTAPSWSRDGSRLAYSVSGKPGFATDWTEPGRNDERIEALSLTGAGAGRVELLARGIWPRWSPTDDRLAFVARLNANWDVYVRSADGANLVRLTNDPGLDTFPIWSADGRAVIFLSNRGNRWDLYKSPADGRGAASRLTNHRRREDQATLSPDGRWVAFTDGPGRRDSRILLLDLASGTTRPLLEVPSGDCDPAWSPDGRRIAFVSRRPSPLVPIPPENQNPGQARESRGDSDRL